VLVVQVEAIGTPAHALQSAKQIVLVDAARAVDFLLRRSVARKTRDLFVDRRLELGRCMARARKRLDLEDRRERVRTLPGVDALRELLVVDEGLVETARLAAGKDLRGDIELGVVGREQGWRQP